VEDYKVQSGNVRARFVNLLYSFESEQKKTIQLDMASLGNIRRNMPVLWIV